MIDLNIIFISFILYDCFSFPQLKSKRPYLNARYWLRCIRLPWYDAFNFILLRQLISKNELCCFTHDDSGSYLFELVFNCQGFFAEADSLAVFVAGFVLGICAEVWRTVFHSVESQVLGEVEEEAGIVTTVADLLLRAYPCM